MKKNKLRKFLSIALSVVMVAAAVPVFGETAKVSGKSLRGESPVAETFDEENLNPEYSRWLENGRKGRRPDMKDLSYLSESAACVPMPCAFFPEKYDLREEGRIEPVYDQGNYQICWAVAANVAASGPLMKRFPQTSFSPYHTAWFTYRGNEEEEMDCCEDPYDCGGFNAQAVGTMAAWKGPVAMDAVSENPYEEENPPENTRYRSDYQLQDSFYLPLGVQLEGTENGVNADIAKRIIMETGPVSLAFLSNEKNYNEEHCAWYNDKEGYTDHQVVLAGWDDHYPKENFNKNKRPEHDGAWLVRNSWGSEWGDDGYFWLSYEDKTATLSSAYVLEENDNYKKNYQYDTIGWCYSIAPDKNAEKSRSGKGANIFKAESSEMLEAVSFYTTDMAAEYKISVYTGVEKGKPESGKCMLTQSDGEVYAGYHTIELDHGIKLNKGENFSIVIELENPQYKYALPVEVYGDYLEDEPVYLGNGGESYVYSNGKWKDIAGEMKGFYVTNLCIKGFTNPLPKSGESVSNVKFSEMEGGLADGTEIELSANGAEEIYYSVNGGPYRAYEEPLIAELPEKDSLYRVSAYSVCNGKKGNTVKKTYTKAVAELSDLAYKDGGNPEHVETDGLVNEHVFSYSEGKNVEVTAQSGDSVFINGKKAEYGSWVKIPFDEDGTCSAEITVKGEGKLDGKYEISFYRNILSYDYEKETIKFNEDKYKVKDEDGKQVHSGDSVTPYLDSENNKLEITTWKGGVVEEWIPLRYPMNRIDIDYRNCRTYDKFGKEFLYSDNPEMKNAETGDGGSVALEPGKNMYFQIKANKHAFRSDIYRLVVPAKPAAPVLEAAEVTETSVKLKPVKRGYYSADGKNWSRKPEFTGLTPGKTYTFSVYREAGKTSFASEKGQIRIKTLAAGNQNQVADKTAETGSKADTGDRSQLPLWILLCITAVAALIVITIISKKKK